jgi:hypothetical protein
MTLRSAARPDGRRCAEVLAALLATFVSVQVRAQSSDPVELAWHAPSGCPGAADVQARIRKLVGSSTVSGMPLRANATITRNAAGGLHLKLVVRGDDLVGERHIDGRSCEDLAGAAAVNLVLLLRSPQPMAAENRSRSAAEASNAREPSPAPDATPASVELQARPDPTRVTRQDQRSNRSWRGLLQVPLASLTLGPLPKPSVGVGLAAGVQLDRWRFLAAATACLGQTLPMPERADLGAHIGRIDAGVRACRTFPIGPFALAPCVSVSLVHVWARGEGSRVAARTAESTWVAASAGVQASVELTEWFGLVAGIDAEIEASRPRFSIDGYGPVGQLGTAAVRIISGCEWIL